MIRNWNSILVDSTNASDVKSDTCWIRAIIALFVSTVFICCFVYYSYIVSYDIFYEADFLHVPFLEGLAKGELSEGSFVSVYGEHFFPGYNFILAVNYYLFGISGDFTAFVSSFSIILTAALLNFILCKYWNFGVFSFLIVCISINAILLSPVNNLFWGMALAAQIGSLFSVFILFRFSEKIGLNRDAVLPFIAIPVSIIFLLGGYSIGLIASVMVAALLILLVRKDLKYSAAVICCVAFSVLIYVMFLNRYGVLFENRPKGEAVSLIKIFQFYLVMSASSVIGSTLIDYVKDLNYYFFTGSVLTVMSFIAILDISIAALRGRVSVISSLVLMLLTYAIVTILFVSIFRVNSGVSAGAGQWYMAHIKFLPFGLVVWLGEKTGAAGRGAWRLSVPAGLALVVIMAFTAVGFRGDWLKGYYVRSWKADIASHALEMLEAPVSQLPSRGMQSLLWEPDLVKRGVDFFYQYNLWIFRTRDIEVQGLGRDGSLAPGKTAYIACPVGTVALAFKVSGDRSMGPLEVRSGEQRQLLDVGGSVNFDFQTKNAVVKLSLPETGSIGVASPASANQGTPALVTDIVCQLAGPRREFPER